MKNLNWLNDDILALLELKEDLLFNKLTRSQVKYYIEGSRNIAKGFAKEFKDQNIRTVLDDNGVEVLIKDKAHKTNLDLRAEIYFDEKTKQIIIYKNSVNQIYKTLKKYISNISEQEVLDIHLAHEFYHFLEFRDSKYTNEQLDKILSFSIGPIKRKLTILKTREVAAHEFCKEFLNLNFHPKILDYIYLIENDQQFKNQFEDELVYLKKKYID